MVVAWTGFSPLQSRRLRAARPPVFPACLFDGAPGGHLDGTGTCSLVGSAAVLVLPPERQLAARSRVTAAFVVRRSGPDLPRDRPAMLEVKGPRHWLQTASRLARAVETMISRVMNETGLAGGRAGAESAPARTRADKAAKKLSETPGCEAEFSNTIGGKKRSMSPDSGAPRPPAERSRRALPLIVALRDLHSAHHRPVGFARRGKPVIGSASGVRGFTA